MGVLIISSLVSSFLASLGFGFLFNIKGKHLMLAGIAGAVGGLLYKFGMYAGWHEMISNFIGALGLTLCSEIFARVYKTPVTTFVVCALIPLVPGGGMYRMMLAAVQGQVDNALSIGLQTLSIAGCLALGILVVSTCFVVFTKSKRQADRFLGKIKDVK